MRFRCPFCSYIIKTAQSYRGQKMKCPSCEKTVLVPNTPFEEGCIIGDFVIQGKVGEGSIGAVYRAEQISLERLVALKILSSEYTNAKGVSDFLREARAAAQLSHPNIVQSLAVGEQDGVCYMAMNFLSGETVKARIKREGKIPVDEALHIVQQVAEALYYAWDESGLIHRDVKPENIMVTSEGIVKLTDLGLAMVGAEWSEDMEISGSPSYMSPEQFSGDKLDTRSDIYSLGVTLYQMLSGKLPFEAETVRSVAKQHFTKEATPLNKLDGRIPQKVSSLVRRMIKKFPEERFANMEELLNKVWTIRQQTAPNRDMVPDVHTISIKRLGYDLQKETIKAKRSVNKEAIESRERANNIYKVMMVVLPVIIVILLMVFIYLGKKKGDESNLKNLVTAYEKKVRSGSSKSRTVVDLIALSSEGKGIIDEFRNSDSAAVKLLKSRVNLLISELEKQKLERTIIRMKENDKEKKSEIELIKKELSKLKKALQQKDHQLEKAKKVVVKPPPDMAKLKAQNRAAKKKTKELAKEKEELARTLAASENSWKRDICFQVTERINQGRLKEAQSIIDVELGELESESGGSRKKWLDGKMEWIKSLRKDYKMLTDSGFKYSGVVLDDERKVASISDGKVQIFKKDDEDNTKNIQIDWEDLEFESALAIAKKEDPKVGEAELRANWLILKGKFPAALEAKPGDLHLIEFCEAVLANKIQEIKYISRTDRRKARNKARDLKKKFRNCEGIDPYLDEIDGILRRIVTDIDLTHPEDY